MALTRRDIARAGLRMLNETGLNGLTLRVIADELGVKPPALYWHVRDKQALLDEMAAEMLRGVRVDERLAGVRAWPEVLRAFAHGLRTLLLSYRDGAKVFSGTYLAAGDETPERLLEPLLDGGLPPRAAIRAMFTVYAYTVGFVIEEQGALAPDGGRDTRYETDLAERVARAARPDVAEALAAGPATADMDEEFAEGLAVVVAGLRARCAPGGGAGR